MQLQSSFRDPSGFLFIRKGVMFRQINIVYKENYEILMKSGLYKELTNLGLLIPHREIEGDFFRPEVGYKVISPDIIPFISYPYEWSFSQLKDAALLTLKIQKISLEFDMSLKDASAYNIQYHNGKPVFIDTLSFERYKYGAPWVAYRQFCQHFLAPLALMSKNDIRLGRLLNNYIDGIPLDLCSKLLPFSSRFSFSLLSHIHLHAKAQAKYANTNQTTKKMLPKISKSSFIGIIESLQSAVKKLKWEHKNTEWSDYYDNTNYSAKAFTSKEKIVENYISTSKPGKVWDIGANDGYFSRIASNKGINTISFDVDPVAVEKNYSIVKRNNENNLLPLFCDLTNPSPGIGWENIERSALIGRGPADLLLALALVHHLAISNNLPFSKIAKFMSHICNQLVIEFVPKSDSQVQRLLANREDIFSDYTQKSFEKEFGYYFLVKEKHGIEDSKRILYLMTKL